MKDLSYRSRTGGFDSRIWPGAEKRPEMRERNLLVGRFLGDRSIKSSDLIIDTQTYFTYTLIHA